MPKSAGKAGKNAKPPLRLADALLPGSRLRPLVCAGLGALGAKAAYIALAERAKAGDSLDIDTAFVAELPNANRWDYLLSVPVAAQLIALEVHHATDSEIDVVIKKRREAMVYLRDHFPPKHRIATWYWVASNKVGFSRMERATKRLYQNGISFAGRQLRRLP